MTRLIFQYFIVIETLGFTFNLYLCHAGNVEAGNVVHGVAWLFGDMAMDEYI